MEKTKKNLTPMALPQPAAGLPRIVTKLTPLQDRFIDEYIIDFKPTAAARRAGFSDPSYGRQLVLKDYIKLAIQRRKDLAAGRTGVTIERVINELTGLHHKALAKEEYTTCVRILELLGRHVGAFEMDNSQKGGNVIVQMNFHDPNPMECAVIKENEAE